MRSRTTKESVHPWDKYSRLKAKKVSERPLNDRVNMAEPNSRQLLAPRRRTPGASRKHSEGVRNGRVNIDELLFWVVSRTR